MSCVCLTGRASTVASDMMSKPRATATGTSGGPAAVPVSPVSPLNLHVDANVLILLDALLEEIRNRDTSTCNLTSTGRPKALSITSAQFVP
jgi:hypothetical protein